MSCPGKTTNGSSKCGRIIFQCKHCGTVGCDRSKKEECSNQLFYNGTCQKCGKAGAKGEHL